MTVLVVTVHGERRLSGLEVLVQIPLVRQREAVWVRGRKCLSQLRVVAERVALHAGQGGQRLSFAILEMLVEANGASHRLAGVVEDVVEPRETLQ